MSSHNTSEWTAIASFSTIQEAAIAKGMLQDNGIPAIINNATISSVLPMTDSWTPLQLMVPATLYSQAIDLLNKDE